MNVQNTSINKKKINKYKGVKRWEQQHEWTQVLLCLFNAKVAKQTKKCGLCTHTIQTIFMLTTNISRLMYARKKKCTDISWPLKFVRILCFCCSWICGLYIVPHYRTKNENIELTTSVLLYIRLLKSFGWMKWTLWIWIILKKSLKILFYGLSNWTFICSPDGKLKYDNCVKHFICKWAYLISRYISRGHDVRLMAASSA